MSTGNSSTPITSNHHMTDSANSITNSSPITDANANPKQQRSVAFGKHFDNLHNGGVSCSNVYHHQLVLYQHPHLQQRLQQTHPLNGLQKHRGFSVPNLGFYKQNLE